MYVLFFFSLSLATSERSSYRRCSLKKSVLKSFAKLTGKYLWQSRSENLKESSTGIFLQFLQNFLRSLFCKTFPGACPIVNTWITNFLRFFFLTYLICIYGSFSSLCICFCFTYWVIMIMQIVSTLTKFVLYVCWVNKLPPSFLFLNQWTDVRRRKKVKNPVNVLPMVQRKP